MRRFLSTGSARSAKLAEGSARGATARKIGWLCRALPGSPYSPRPNGRGFFFSPSGRNTPSNSSFVALRNVSLQLAGGSFTFLLRRCRKGRCKAQRLPEAPPMQKSRRLFFAFAAASALGAATLLTGCHHWPHRQPPPGGGRPGGPGRPGPGSGGPGGRPGPGFGGRPGPGFGGRLGPR